MATSVAHRLGVPMGQDLAYTFEDPKMNRLLEQPEFDESAFAALVEQRNEEHKLWGFKYPFTLRPRVLETLRNPHLLVVYRDLVAIARRNEISTGHDFLTSMRAAAGHQIQIISVLAETEYPCLLFSYEKAIEFPLQLTTQISTFLGLNADAEKRQAVADTIRTSPAEYVSKAQPLVGHVDILHQRAVAGWALDQSAPAKPVTVELHVNGECVRKMSADRARPDLVDKFGGSGHHGFRFNSEDTPITNLEGIEVFALAGNGARLRL